MLSDLALLSSDLILCMAKDAMTRLRGRASRRRSLAAWLISRMPQRRARVLLYRVLLGYEIEPGAAIGLGTRIDVYSAKIGRARIGVSNLFVGPMELLIEDNVRVFDRNLFEAYYWALGPSAGGEEYALFCHIRKGGLVNVGHFIDCTGGFELGPGAWLAGRASQVWTHGPGSGRRSVSIGANCYVGSAARFAPGSSVAESTTVAMGAVISGSFFEKAVLLGGVPARVLRREHRVALRSQPPESAPDGCAD